MIRRPKRKQETQPTLSAMVVHFRALEKPKENDFSLDLAKCDTYDEVVDRVAQRLGVDDSSRIRLTPHNYHSQQPKSNPIKYRSVDRLVDMLIHYNKISDILYYEVLDIPLPELQCLKTLKVSFHHSTRDEVEILNLRLPKQCAVGDLLNEIKSKVELSHPYAELRLLEVFYHKIYKIFPLNEKIEHINDQYWTLRAEEIPEEEKNLGPTDRLIHVYHCKRDTLQNRMEQNFGEPFFLVIHEGEALAEIKVRIQKKLQVPNEEFSKWKFAFIKHGYPEYLQDFDIVSRCFQQRRDVYGAWEQYLGLEHADTPSKRSYVSQETYSRLAHNISRPETARSAAPIKNLVIDDTGSFVDSSSSVMENCYRHDEGNSSAASSCIVCYEAPIEGACVPCGHMAGCMSCLNEIKATRRGCPVCRIKIKSVLRLYAF